MFYLALFSNPAGTAERILTDSQRMQTAIADAMNQLWRDTLGSGIYGALTWLGVGIAIMCLTILMTQFAKAAMEDELSQEAFAQLIWPIIVAILLAGNGTLLAQCTFGLRAIINHTNALILDNANARTSLQVAYKQVTEEIGATQAIKTIITQCDGRTNPQEQTECLNRAAQQVEQIANSLEKPSPGFLQQVWDFVRNPVGAVNDVASDLTNAVLETSLSGCLMAFALGFQWLVEVSLLLTAVLAPMAVGGSLLPVGTKSIFVWLMGFFSVGFWKICYNIMVGLVAVLLMNAQQVNEVAFAFAVGLLAPFFATLLACGAGMAVMNTFLNGSFGLLRFALSGGR